MNATNQTTQLIKQGWTSSPDGRGTIDILWSCLLTLFLCGWSVLVVNVPIPGSTTGQKILRKLVLVGLTGLAPEIVFQIALGQWVSARQSVEMFHSSGYMSWTIRHGFYANMGGFHLQPRDWRPFPINARQLHWLVESGHVDFPSVNVEHIRDKNKVDGMLRFITLVQIVWFGVNILARAGQGLVITAVELSTCAFVMMAVMTSFFWRAKPADVEYPDFIPAKASLVDILNGAGDEAGGVYYNTPLDFAGREEWQWSIVWAHGLNCLRRIGIAWPSVDRPLRRVQDTVVPPIQGLFYGIFVVTTLSYFGVFIAGWNFSFPTRIEMILWRAASMTTLISALAVWACLLISARYDSMYKGKLSPSVSDSSLSGNVSGKQVVTAPRVVSRLPWGPLRSLIALLKNNSVAKDPALDASPTLVFSIWFFGIFYCSSRGYITIADFMELRSLPPSAYQSVNWAAAWPHF